LAGLSSNGGAPRILRGMRSRRDRPVSRSARIIQQKLRPQVAGAAGGLILRGGETPTCVPGISKSANCIAIVQWLGLPRAAAVPRTAGGRPPFLRPNQDLETGSPNQGEHYEGISPSILSGWHRRPASLRPPRPGRRRACANRGGASAMFGPCANRRGASAMSQACADRRGASAMSRACADRRGGFAIYRRRGGAARALQVACFARCTLCNSWPNPLWGSSAEE